MSNWINYSLTTHINKPASIPNAVGSPQLPQVNTSSLAHPSKGLAWSNRMVSNEVLCKNALIRSSYDLILEAVLEYGENFVHKQWADLLADSSIDISEAVKATVERQLRNIHTGICNAEARRLIDLKSPTSVKGESVTRQSE